MISQSAPHHSHYCGHCDTFFESAEDWVVAHRVELYEKKEERESG